jgi:hypothetical protein
MTTTNDELRSSQPAASPDQPVPDEFDLLCEHCGYSLVGLTTSNRCPECGEEFDPKELPLARVPWLFRRRHGKLRSYFQTVCLILQNPSAFAKELCRPVRLSAQDARQFRRWTIRIAMLTTILAAIVIGLCGLARNLSIIRTPLRREEILVLVLACIMIPWSIVLLNIMLRLMTDLPTFIWSGLDGDPINLAPLHHYASAPLALAPILLVPTTAGALIFHRLALLNMGFVMATNFVMIGMQSLACSGAGPLSADALAAELRPCHRGVRGDAGDSGRAHADEMRVPQPLSFLRSSKNVG